jgi:hypothetical protein
MYAPTSLRFSTNPCSAKNDFRWFEAAPKIHEKKRNTLQKTIIVELMMIFPTNTITIEYYLFFVGKVKACSEMMEISSVIFGEKRRT